MYWLFEARRRFGLVVLNFIVTSNHIHLLVIDRGDGEIWRSMQLIAGRTAQEYNNRKIRRGAFWEDRYHSTAIQSDHHLQHCISYIDLNMVRAGVVEHPSQWRHSGYAETLTPRSRYQRLDLEILSALMGAASVESHCRHRAAWVDTQLSDSELVRNPVWTETVAVGNYEFVDEIHSQLKTKNPRRKVVVNEEECCLRDSGRSLYRVSEAESAFYRFRTG